MMVRGEGRSAEGHRRRPLGVATAAVLIVAACAGGTGDDAANEDDEPDAEADATTTTDVLENPRWANVESGPEATDDAPVAGGSIVVALSGETNSYLPSESTAASPGMNVAAAIFDPLVTRDSSGELRPYLAESLEPDEDFTAWTLRLRPGVQFHDDTPLNAQTMKRMWDDYYSTSPLTQTTTARLVERLEVVDELTVRYVMTEPNPTFPELLEIQFGWPFSPDAADRLGEEFGERPVGTGAFRFVSWQRDSELVVERNPDYCQEGLPYVDRITFRIIPDEATRAASLASGDIDALQNALQTSSVPELADIEEARVVLGLGNQAGGVMFNTDEPPTDDLRVRRSLVHAVDQDALIQVMMGEAAELSEARTQFVAQDSPFYSTRVADAWPAHDPERARELYEDYVNDPQRSDGKDVGEPVSLTFNTRTTPGDAELAAAYEGFYEAIGYEVEVQPLEMTQHIAAAVAGDFQVSWFAQGRNASPLGEFLFYYDDPAGSVTNFTNFHDETVAGIIDQLRGAGTVAEQAALAEEMGLHLADQVPWQWTGTDLTLIAAHQDLRGLRSWEFPDGALGDGVTPGIAQWAQVWLDG